MCSQVDGVLPTHNMNVYGGQCVPKWTRSSLPLICMYMGGSTCSQVDGVLPIHNIYIYVYGSQCVPQVDRVLPIPLMCMYMGESTCSQVDGALWIHVYWA
jgi:hypothetical protein